MSVGLLNLRESTGLLFLRKGNCVILGDQVGIITQGYGVKVLVKFRDEKKSRPVDPNKLMVTDLNWPDTVDDIQGYRR